jgi:hypothetical protein
MNADNNDKWILKIKYHEAEGSNEFEFDNNINHYSAYADSIEEAGKILIKMIKFYQHPISVEIKKVDRRG